MKSAKIGQDVYAPTLTRTKDSIEFGIRHGQVTHDRYPTKKSKLPVESQEYTVGPYAQVRFYDQPEKENDEMHDLKLLCETAYEANLKNRDKLALEVTKLSKSPFINHILRGKLFPVFTSAIGRLDELLKQHNPDYVGLPYVMDLGEPEPDTFDEEDEDTDVDDDFDHEENGDFFDEDDEEDEDDD